MSEEDHPDAWQNFLQWFVDSMDDPEIKYLIIEKKPDGGLTLMRRTRLSEDQPQ